jgi:hypothetical protein
MSSGSSMLVYTSVDGSRCAPKGVIFSTSAVA